MSLENGVSWAHAGLKLQGLSLSGIRTCMTLPELSLAFDVAQGLPYAQNMKRFFITHGHLDHSAGVPYIISQKTMHKQPAPDFYMPEALVEPLHQMMSLWKEIEGHDYPYRFHGLKGDEKIELNHQKFMVPFPTIHRVPSLGYTIFESKKKLKAEFQKKTESELRELALGGEALQEVHEIPLLTFSGDTRVGFLEARPWIKKSKILMLEATYLDDRKSVEHAHKWGHTHFDELLPLLPSIESEKIVIIHLSSRYSTREALQILSERLPKSEQERVVLFPGR